MCCGARNRILWDSVQGGSLCPWRQEGPPQRKHTWDESPIKDGSLPGRRGAGSRCYMQAPEGMSRLPGGGAISGQWGSARDEAVRHALVDKPFTDHARDFGTWEATEEFCAGHGGEVFVLRWYAYFRKTTSEVVEGLKQGCPTGEDTPQWVLVSIIEVTVWSRTALRSQCLSAAKGPFSLFLWGPNRPSGALFHSPTGTKALLCFGHTVWNTQPFQSLQQGKRQPEGRVLALLCFRIKVTHVISSCSHDQFHGSVYLQEAGKGGEAGEMPAGHHRPHPGKLGWLDERRMGLERRRSAASGLKVIETTNNWGNLVRGDWEVARDGYCISVSGIGVLSWASETGRGAAVEWRGIRCILANAGVCGA